MYPAATKVLKQLKYAHKRGIPIVLFLGKEELAKGEFIVKNMADGQQVTHPIDIERFSSWEF